MSAPSLRRQLVKRATELGFDGCRITAARLPEKVGERLMQTIAKERHGSMAWLQSTLARRKSPEAMWPQARSVILLAMNYGPQSDPMALLANREKGIISVYARGRDYHDLIKGRLKQLAGWFASQSGADVKVFVDTAPLMEKPLAAQAGIGWQGKHTNLVSREFGSWLFLGAILTDADLEPDEPGTDHCGNCRACLDVCPTDAFPAPYQLDARRCISYLTIEHKGPIPKEFRKPMANRIFGCDDCLAVCPWNKYAQAASEAGLTARADLEAPELEALAGLDDKAFRKKFSASPVKRLGRNRFLRNVLIAIGNSQDKNLSSSARDCLSDPDPLVRGAAVWALSQLLDQAEFETLARDLSPNEPDDEVRAEWADATGAPQ